MTATEAAAPVRPDEGAWGYRPHLDGLRAVAVFLVVAFHAGADRLSGGFIGVDVFFVLSGYLVTQLLLRDLRTDGRIGYRRFYARRFRRLLPAAAVVLVVTAIVFPGISAPARLPEAEDAIRAASLYFANWFFIGQASDYFAGNVLASPVVHFWSLSVEEQFYVAWPLLLGGIYAAARRLEERAWTAVRIAVAVGLLASLGNALRLADTQLNRAYYGTDTRAYQLLAGALLALSPALIAALRGRPGLRLPLGAGTLVSLAGLVVLATSFVDVSAITRGVLATALTVTLVTCLEATTGGPVRWALSLEPVVFLGRISYGIYLWRWLVILVTIDRFELSPLAVAAVASVVASGLAALSYQLLEMPVRASAWLEPRRLRVVAVGLASSALIGLVVGPQVLNRDASADAVVVAGGTAASDDGEIPDDLDWRGAAEDHGAFPVCVAATVEKCTLVQGPAGAPHLLLMGDSNARMYIPPLTKLAEGRGLTLSVAVAPGCPWQQGILRRGEGPIGNVVQDLGPPCREHHAEWYDTIIPALDPDVMILANQPWDDPQSTRQIQDEDSGAVEVGTDGFVRVVRDRTQETVDAFRADGRIVVMIEPVPVALDREDPLVCLSEAKRFEECEFETHEEPTPLERVYRDLAADDPEGVHALDLDRPVCPDLPICAPVIGGLIVRWDPAHLTQRFATTLSPVFGQYFQAAGIIDPAAP